MLKIFYIILFFLISNFIFSQNKKFVYEYKFIQDSSKINDISKEIMILNINKNQSDFYSYETFKIDSTIASLKENGKSFDLPSKKTLDWRIHKDTSTGEILFYNNITYTYYCANQILKFDYKITSERDKILGYSVQKATFNYGGRFWTAWFSTEIPIHDGPYKFYGLPGLILKISDDKNDHIFELKGILNDTESFKYPIVYKYSQKAKLPIEKYYKIYKDYRKNPLNNAMEFSDFYDSNGNFISASQSRREFEAFQKNIIDKDNNIIEIDLLRK